MQPLCSIWFGGYNMVSKNYYICGMFCILLSFCCRDTSEELHGCICVVAVHIFMFNMLHKLWKVTRFLTLCTSPSEGGGEVGLCRSTGAVSWMPFLGPPMTYRVIRNQTGFDQVRDHRLKQWAMVGFALDLVNYHCFSVLWRRWLGHLTCKIVTEMTL